MSIFEEWNEMMKDIHFPRWDELPDIDLYKDQVVTLVTRFIEPLNINSDTLITPSIINNYVKSKMVPKPSKNKLYSREHIAYFIVISLLKQIFSLPDIKIGMDFSVKKYGEVEAYNKFITMLEYCMKNIGNNEPEIKEELNSEEYGLYFGCTALANKLVSRKYFKLLKSKIYE